MRGSRVFPLCESDASNHPEVVEKIRERQPALLRQYGFRVSRGKLRANFRLTLGDEFQRCFNYIVAAERYWADVFHRAIKRR